MDKSIIFMEKYKKGDFKWKDGIEDSEIVFVESENGRFLIGYDPYEEHETKPIFE